MPLFDINRNWKICQADVAKVYQFLYYKIMKPVNISALVKKYGASYVARNKKTGKVLAHSKRIDVLVKKMKEKLGVTISWIPRENARNVFKISL